MPDYRDFLPPPPWGGPPIPKGLQRRKRTHEEYLALEHQVTELLEQGLAYQAVADRLGVALSYVFTIAKRSGRVPRRLREREEYLRLVGEVVALAGQGLTHREIGERLGIKMSYISSIIQRERKKWIF